MSHERSEPLQTASPPLSALRLDTRLRILVCRAQQVYGYHYTLHHCFSGLLFMPAVIDQERVAKDYAGSILAPRRPFEQKMLSPSPPLPPLGLRCCRLGMLQEQYAEDRPPP